MKFKRIISVCIAVVITFSMNLLMPVMAEEMNLDFDYYMTLDPNGEEYQNWKSEYVLDNMNENGVSTFSARNSANGISNDYIELTLNGYNYTLGTIEGNPNSTTDNNKTLLYGYPNGGTSYTTIQIDGVNNVFKPETTTYRENSIISTGVIGDVIVTQYLNIVNNQYTNCNDVAEFFYTVENTGADDHNIGIRIMFDTMLGSNDSAPFRLPEIGDVTTETDLSGAAIPEFWQAFDSLTYPSVIAQGTLNIDTLSTPDRVRFTNWGAASRNLWDYIRSSESNNGDSAVCLYWNPKLLGANETLSCKTYYGLSSLQQSNEPPLAVAISGATKLEVIEDKKGMSAYSPNPFTVTAYVQNIGTGTAYNTNVELTLPKGMNVVDGSTVVSLGDIPVSNKQIQVSWKVEVEPSAIDKIETYGVIVTADNAETKTLERKIEIPSLVNNNVELMLDRSVISDGSSLNLKFKIINISNEPIALNQICPRYYYIDESPKSKKQFNCYSVHMNQPYSYLSNSIVTMIDKELEVESKNATSYFEFAFNTDKELQPNQEIIVNIGINNSSWAKIVSSNDYSAVGDDSLASNGYVSWEYMPVFSSANSKHPIWGKIPEISADGMNPDLLVEFNPNAVDGKGCMNLNIRITNNGLLPVDLGHTEIKYYYTNDNGYTQSVAGNYIAKSIGSNNVSIQDKASIEVIKMDVRKKMADTYVSVKFKEDTGILNFEDYIDLNIMVYNTDWKSGDYILENDYSYQEEEQKIQTFSSMTRNASNTANMRVTNNIVVSSMFIPFIPPIPTDLLKTDFLIGIEPMDKYEPTYAAFKIGEGLPSIYEIDDYNKFIEIFEYSFNGNPYNEYSIGQNIDNAFSFEYENLKALLKADIAYISGHGFDGGVLPIYKNAFNSNGERIYVNNYDKILSTDKYIGTNFHRYGGSEIPVENVFSLNMKDHPDEFNDNLKWIITSACSQLSETTSFEDQEDITTSSLQRWINVLKNNSNLKGIIGYYGTAPGADNAWTPDKKVIDDFLSFSADGKDIYTSWLKANTKDYSIYKQHAGLLVKANYEKETLDSSLCDNIDVTYSSMYLYKFSTGISDWSTTKEEVYTKGGHGGGGSIRALAITAINNYIEENSLPIDDTQVFISEVSCDIYDYNGEYIENDVVDYIFDFKTETPSIQTFSFSSNSDSTIKLKFNIETSTVAIME